MFNIKLIDDLKNKFFNKVDDKIFLKKSSNSSIYLIFQPSFYDIESLLKNTHILISCHGSVTHAANSFDIIKIDILEKNMVNFYKRFTFYLKKHHTIYRSGFENLKSQIYDKISTLKI